MIRRMLVALTALGLVFGTAAATDPKHQATEAHATAIPPQGWVTADNSREYWDGDLYVRIWVEVQFFLPCPACLPNRARVFGSARRMNPNVGAIQIGMDNPTTPSARLGISSGFGGILDENTAHYNTGSTTCCVSVWTGARAIAVANPEQISESYKGRIWVSFRLNGNLVEYPLVYSLNTLQSYYHGAYAGGDGGCVGEGCGGF